MDWNTSRRLFTEALSVIPGGVNSPVRAFGAVGSEPLFIEKAKGSRVWDEDGNEYIDYVGSWGPAILGHAHPEVTAVVAAAAEKGLSFGAPTRAETLLAKKILAAFPSMEKIRFVSSGTEACMSAIRLARAYTGRTKILKFTGNYHGHADILLVKAGSGLATFGLPDSAGVPADAVKDTLLAPYNDLDAVAALFKQCAGMMAAAIVEPIAGNAGFIRPNPGFLEGLQALCREHKALLILDEVMTGFRVGYGGMQTILGLDPDLTTLAKVIGGGLPLAAYGGKAAIMRMVAPEGPMYQAGTLSGNPLATACGLKTLELLSAPGVYDTMRERTRTLAHGLCDAAEKFGFPASADYEGAMFGLFFSAQPVRSFEEAQAVQNNPSCPSLFPRYFRKMLQQGIYLAPSAYEAGFTSLAHTIKDIEQTVQAAERVFAALREEYDRGQRS